VLFCVVLQIENTIIVSKLIANDNKYNLVIHPDIEVDTLLEENNFAKAEKLAREKILDSSVPLNMTSNMLLKFL
jgi:hypothetical protein